MTLWRPPRSNQERAIRAIRSMQNGSIDGRIVSAYPVKPDTDEEDYEIYTDLDAQQDDDSGGGGGTTATNTIKPWTDYFDIKGINSVHTYALTKTPWEQPKMPAATRSYSSVHVYWNGVFQPDMGYMLETSIITILDPEFRLRVGDTITVKYFYDQDASAVVDENTYRMQCWFASHEAIPVDRPGYNIFWGGVLEATPVGVNTGKITTTAGRYYTLQATGTWNSRFRIPPGQKIPLGPDVAGVTWRISFDPGADVSIDTIYGPEFFAKGNDYGEIICHKTCCGFQVGGDDCECGSAQLPLLRYDNTQGPFNPTFGPIGGQVFASGSSGIELAKQVNARNNDPTWGWYVHREMPHYDPVVPYNAGCTYAGGIANAEDTIYGKHSHETATYDVKIGVTATVIKK